MKDRTNEKLCDDANLIFGAFLFNSPWIYELAAAGLGRTPRQRRHPHAMVAIAAQPRSTVEKRD